MTLLKLSRAFSTERFFSESKLFICENDEFKKLLYCLTHIIHKYFQECC
jgi:hypothetical protein